MSHPVSMRTPSVRRYLDDMAEHGPGTDTQMSKRLGVTRIMAGYIRRFLADRGRVQCIGYGPQPEHGPAGKLWELIDA